MSETGYATKNRMEKPGDNTIYSSSRSRNVVRADIVA